MTDRLPETRRPKPCPRLWLATWQPAAPVLMSLGYLTSVPLSLIIFLEIHFINPQHSTHDLDVTLPACASGAKLCAENWSSNSSDVSPL